MERAMLDAEQGNNHQACKVYQRMGFKIVNQFTSTKSRSFQVAIDFEGCQCQSSLGEMWEPKGL